eukprot:COSAG01_NODE_2193_length_8183_cov_3.620609_1_plen_79_part_00
MFIVEHKSHFVDLEFEDCMMAAWGLSPPCRSDPRDPELLSVIPQLIKDLLPLLPAHQQTLTRLRFAVSAAGCWCKFAV